MRFLEFIRLNEMNVSNLDTIKNDFSKMLAQSAQGIQYNIPAPLFDLIVKRAVKAMQNDEAGNMVTKHAIYLSDLSNDAPEWLRKTLERGDDVFDIAFKDGFQNRLAHVVDWIKADPEAGKVIKAAPEQDFLGHLGKAADDFFEKYNAAVAKSAEETQKKQEAHSEPGREVVMTFRKSPVNNEIKPFTESDLNDNANGPVVCFWVNVISAEALNREGKVMNHCVGSYANLVKAEDVVIYSLRDMKNEPHVTIELNNTRYGSPTINQVKGKGNRPPPGRYSVYVKDFLNSIGAKASYEGKNDLQGLGLLSHEGKFGTILDVGGTILDAFDNGDTIRSLDDEDVVYYVEKDGTTPFSFHTEFFVKSPRGDVKNVSGPNFYRKEVSRFPVYAKNMIRFLNSKKLNGRTKTLEIIGVFYDSRRNLWGTRADLSENLFDYKGVVVSRIAEDIFFSDHKGTVFATASFVRDQLSKVQTINDCEATKLIPELIREFGNRVIKNQMTNKDARDYFGDNGVFWNNSKETYTLVPEEKSVIFKSKNGHVCHYMNRLFFFDPSKTLLGSLFVGKETIPFEYEEGKLTTYSASGKLAIFKLLSDMSNRPDQLISIKYINARNCRENGFYRAVDRLIPLEDVEKDYKLGNGYVASVQINDAGEKTITLRDGEEDVADLWVDEKNVAKRIRFLWKFEDEGVKKSLDVDEIRRYVAAMLNATGVKMKRVDALSNNLLIKNNKFAALDPKRDKMLMGFVSVNGRVDLGNNFEFRRLIDLNSGVLSRNRHDGDRQDKRFGYVQHMEDRGTSGYRSGDTVCNIDFSSTDFDNLSYHMYKNLPEGVTRQQVIAAVAKFMHYYHDKIEPMMTTDLWSTS